MKQFYIEVSVRKWTGSGLNLSLKTIHRHAAPISSRFKIRILQCWDHELDDLQLELLYEFFKGRRDIFHIHFMDSNSLRWYGHCPFCSWHSPRSHRLTRVFKRLRCVQRELISSQLHFLILYSWFGSTKRKLMIIVRSCYRRWTPPHHQTLCYHQTSYHQPNDKDSSDLKFKNSYHQ